MNDTFLLYIDILGFTEMTRNEPRKVARVYAILDSLNVHRHASFKTIVFSDTVLVYNPQPAKTDEERKYLVWYLTEFAEDLHHRLTGQDIYFRAVLTTGSFSHYSLKNVECFFGEALIDAYLKEKLIPAVGLFLDGKCMKYNQYFRIAKFDSNFSFVFLNRHLEYLNQYSGGQYPMVDPTLADQAPYLPWQVRFLQDIHRMMRTHTLPSVRAKFLTCWDFHKQRFPEMIAALEGNAFALTALGQKNAWLSLEKTMHSEIRYFKRIGSGTMLSMQITKDNRSGKASSRSASSGKRTARL